MHGSLVTRHVPQKSPVVDERTIATRKPTAIVLPTQRFNQAAIALFIIITLFSKINVDAIFTFFTISIGHSKKI